MYSLLQQQWPYSSPPAGATVHGTEGGSAQLCLCAPFEDSHPHTAFLELCGRKKEERGKNQRHKGNK